MTESREWICLHCGQKYHDGPPPEWSGCPRCGRKTPREVTPWRMRCENQETCSLIVHHKGECVPWPYILERPSLCRHPDHDLEAFCIRVDGHDGDHLMATPEAVEKLGEPMQLDPKDGQVGVYNKYHVQRTDGRDVAGEKHESCAYFVLDLTHDPHAVPALRAYAQSCRRTHPDLAIDLWKTVGMREDEDPDVDLALWSPLQTLEEADHG